MEMLSVIHGGDVRAAAVLRLIRKQIFRGDLVCKCIVPPNHET